MSILNSGYTEEKQVGEPDFIKYFNSFPCPNCAKSDECFRFPYYENTFVTKRMSSLVWGNGDCFESKNIGDGDNEENKQG